MQPVMRRFAAEWLGTSFLLAAVVGSGIMATKLAGGNAALALLCNTLPTGAILTVLILTFGPLSGAQFNPAVSIASALRREMMWSDMAFYVVAQVSGAVFGVWIAHSMFGLPMWQLSATARRSRTMARRVRGNVWIVAHYPGMKSSARTPAAVPYAVGLYITSAYWFTASTSFANPAVTCAVAF